MKSIKNIIRISFLLLTVAFVACEEKENSDTIAPGKVRQVALTPQPGGTLISYELPDDSDIAFVRAEYTNSLGENMFKVTSSYHNTILIDGYNDTESHPLSLAVVDHAGNESEKVWLTFTPLKSHIELVKESCTVIPTFGGVRVAWTNESAKPVYVMLFYIDEATGKKVTEYFASNKKEDVFTMKGLDMTDREFFVQVEDYYGNKTEEISKGTLRPLFERVIDKSKWSLVQSLSINGDAWEGLTVNVWDDVVDTKESNDDNSYCIITRDNNGGQLNFPLDIVIDMGEAVQVNRLQFWQRAYWYGNDTEYLYYQNENVKAFEIYVSNDLSNWELAGSVDLGDPKNDDLTVPQEYIDQAIEGHEYNLPQTAGPFRYLKVSITENYGSESEVCFSELTLYGG